MHPLPVVCSNFLSSSSNSNIRVSNLKSFNRKNSGKGPESTMPAFD